MAALPYEASRMTCPVCGSPRVYPSRPRNLVERIRLRMTDRQPHRCHACHWRAWRDVAPFAQGPDTRPDDLRTGTVPAPMTTGDLDRLDSTKPRS